MRTVLGTVLAFLWLTLARSGPVGGTAVAAGPGDQIRQFLSDIQKNRLAVKLDHLNPNFHQVGVVPPNPVAGTVPLANGCCGDEARKTLADVLQVLPQAPPNPFVPDYCVVYRNEKRQTRLLWISSGSPLQMRYYASDGTSPDQCEISESTPGEVRDKLDGLSTIAASSPIAAYGSITSMVGKIEKLKLPIDLMSIDPKQVENVFSQKRWNILGKVSITTADESGRLDVCAAMNLAFDKDNRPKHAAHVFTPRLAVSVSIPTDLPRPAPQCQKYLVLMSFECRLAELYVDQQFRGCCAINNGWNLPKGSTGAGAAGGLGLQLSSDQILNDILVKAGKPLKPKSTSSNN
jgi:hypothetical protein